MRANVSFGATQAYTLAQALGSFSDPSYYQDLSSGFSMGPQADAGVTDQFENTHPAAFADQSNQVRNALASFNGSERIYAGCEPIDLFVSEDFGQSWLRVESVWDDPDMTGSMADADPVRVNPVPAARLDCKN